MTASAPYTASVHIDADPDRVFDYFTRPEAIVRWMGDYAMLDPTPGGQFTLDINGVPVRGRYLAIDRPRRLLLSWGHAGSDRLPPGASTLEVTLTPRDGGTTVTIVHAGLPAPEDRQHRLGWPHFLDRLVIAAAGGDPGPPTPGPTGLPPHRPPPPHTRPRRGVDDPAGRICRWSTAPTTPASPAPGPRLHWSEQLFAWLPLPLPDRPDFRVRLLCPAASEEVRRPCTGCLCHAVAPTSQQDHQGAEGRSEPVRPDRTRLRRWWPAAEPATGPSLAVA